MKAAAQSEMVERLRMPINSFEAEVRHYSDGSKEAFHPTMLAAADEIERLQRELSTVTGLWTFWNDKAQELARTLGVERGQAFDLAARLAEERRQALEEAAQIAEAGPYHGGFQTAGDERRAKDIAARIRSASPSTLTLQER